MNRCVFDFGEVCSALKHKKCKGCKFRKTGLEWNRAQEDAEIILHKKGLVRDTVERLDGTQIVTTRRIKKLVTERR